MLIYYIIYLLLKGIFAYTHCQGHFSLNHTIHHHQLLYIIFTFSSTFKDSNYRYLQIKVSNQYFQHYIWYIWVILPQKDVQIY